MQAKLAAHHRETPLQLCSRRCRTRVTHILTHPVSPRQSQQLVTKRQAPHPPQCVKSVTAQSAALEAVATVETSETAAAGDTAQIPAIELSVKTVQAFTESFAALQHKVDWLADSAHFEQQARAVLDSTCDHSVLQQLADFTTSTDAPSAVLLTGLPVEDDVPPNIGDTPIQKVTQTDSCLC